MFRFVPVHAKSEVKIPPLIGAMNAIDVSTRMPIRVLRPMTILALLVRQFLCLFVFLINCLLLKPEFRLVYPLTTGLAGRGMGGCADALTPTPVSSVARENLVSSGFSKYRFQKKLRTRGLHFKNAFAVIKWQENFYLAR
jgi:hypothetical protein